MPATLKIGATGANVIDLQNRLNSHPPTSLPPLEADGRFGSKTQDRVKEFQRNNSLESDGVVGPLTWGALFEILVNTTARGAQQQPAVGSFRISGSDSELFFVVWADNGTGDIRGQLIKTNGQKAGGEFVVNTPAPTATNTNRRLPALAHSYSGPIVVWIENAVNPPGPRPHVKMQRFNGDAQKVGPEIQVSTSDVAPEHRPAITSMIDGGVLVTWVDARADQRIRAQRFNIDGAKTGPEFVVNTTPGLHESPSATRLMNGNYVIAWSALPRPGVKWLVFRMFNLEGMEVRGETTPRLSGFLGEKSMTFLDDGRFVIAHVKSQGVSDLGVAKSIVEANLFQANGESSNIAYSATSERGINSAWPVVAPLQGGRFLLAWLQKSAETFATNPSIHPNAIPIAKARVFDAGRGAVDYEAQISTTATDLYHLSAATTVAAGDGEVAALLAWTDPSRIGGDGSDYAIRGCPLHVIPRGGLR